MEFVEINPHEVLFSQCCIKPTFKDGRVVEHTITMLVEGRISPRNIETIRVCMLPNGNIHSLDNRRLYTFKEAIKRGAPFRTVTVKLSSRKRELDDLERKMKNPPSNDWSVVKIKHDCKPIYNQRIQNTASRPNNRVLHTRTQDNSVNISRPPRMNNYDHDLYTYTRAQDNSVNISRPISARLNNHDYDSYTRAQDTRTPNTYYSSYNTRTQDTRNLLYSHARKQDTRTNNRTSLHSSYTRTSNSPFNLTRENNSRTNLLYNNLENENRRNRRKQEGCC